MTPSEFREWLVGLAAAEAMIPARIVLERLPDLGEESNTPAPEPPPTPDRLLSVTQAAQRLGVSPRWVYRHYGQLPCARRIGRTLRVDARGLETWIARRGRS